MEKRKLKTGEATGDLIGNKIADKITSVSKKSPQTNLDEANSEVEVPKEKHISPEKRQQIIDELRLAWYINKMEYQK